MSTVSETLHGGPVDDAEVVVAGARRRTDASGTTTVVTGAGNVDITVLKPGFVPVTTSVQVGAGATQDVIVELQQQPSLEESVTVVASTRTDKRLEDQPMRVEVLAREEIEEKMLMTPGDIVMMLNEMGGMRVQATSPSLGAASSLCACAIFSTVTSRARAAESACLSAWFARALARCRLEPWPAGRRKNRRRARPAATQRVNA